MTSWFGEKVLRIKSEYERIRGTVIKGLMCKQSAYQRNLAMSQYAPSHHESPLMKIFLALTSSPEPPMPTTMPAPPCIGAPAIFCGNGCVERRAAKLHKLIRPCQGIDNQRVSHGSAYQLCSHDDQTTIVGNRWICTAASLFSLEIDLCPQTSFEGHDTHRSTA